MDRGVGCLCTQTLGETFRGITRRIADPLAVSAAVDAVTGLALGWPVLGTTVATTLEALRGVERYQFSYWDAQLWATAKANGTLAILTEDFQDGCEIEGVRFANPFAEGFDLDAFLVQLGAGGTEATDP